jgi:transposase
MQKYKITSEQSTEIREKIRGYEKTSAFRKLQAVMLIGEGMDVQTVARTTMYHYKWVYELVKQYCTRPFDEFVRETRGGANHQNLTTEKEDEIIKGFEKKGNQGEVVSLSEIKKEYDEALGRESSNSTFYLFIHRKDWRKVKPRGAHPKKANEEAINASKKLTQL